MIHFLLLLKWSFFRGRSFILRVCVCVCVSIFCPKHLESHANLKVAPMPPLFPQKIGPYDRGLLRDNDGLHNPSIRPAISWEGWHLGGVKLDSPENHRTNSAKPRTKLLTPGVSPVSSAWMPARQAAATPDLRPC